jgi:hypothetical protein
MIDWRTELGEEALISWSVAAAAVVPMGRERICRDGAWRWSNAMSR